jgi:alpha-glucosidase
MKLFCKTQLFTALFLAACPVVIGAQKQFSLSSPDGRISAGVTVGSAITWSLAHEGDVMIAPSAVSMTTEGVASFGIEGRLAGSSTRKVDTSFAAPIYKRAVVRDNFNELTLRFRGDYNLIFRAYDDGVAYRWEYTGKTPFTVLNEQAEFRFAPDVDAVFSYVRGGGNGTVGTVRERQFRNSFEDQYAYISLSEWEADRLAFLPVVAGGPGGKKVLITEADLMNYPGMYLDGDRGDGILRGVYATYPKTLEQGGHNRLQMLVTERENHIAKVAGPEKFPWRIAIVAANDAELLDSDMVYKISTPPTGDYGWVRPGKVAWDWWNAWNLRGVDFKSGVNNDTYKYYIDFASHYGIEYVILDEGWAVNKQADLMQVVPEIDLPGLVDYAATKNVGIILWAGYWAFDRDMENVCRHYAAMGVKGFKVDFMDRDDQPMVDFHRRAAGMGAKYGLMMDFHGTYKPAGLHRTYPNVINFEGVNGLEQMKWATDLDQVTYDVTIPFVRQVAGPMDYTQGAIRNASRGNFRAVNSEAMSQGTRCRQLAEYVVFESPLNMLCDSPSNYMDEKECTEFIAAIPTVWDETVALGGEIAKYVSIARRNGDEWYVGAMTNWDARTLTLDLSFLGEGSYTAEIFRDGINANRNASDYKKETLEIPADRNLTVTMAPGGGWVARIYKKSNS